MFCTVESSEMVLFLRDAIMVTIGYTLGCFLSDGAHLWRWTPSKVTLSILLLPKLNRYANKKNKILKSYNPINPNSDNILIYY